MTQEGECRIWAQKSKYETCLTLWYQLMFFSLFWRPVQFSYPTVVFMRTLSVSYSFFVKMFYFIKIANDRFFNKFIQYLTSLTPSQRLAVWLKRKGRMLLSMDVMAVWRNRDCALVNRHMVASHRVHIQVQWGFTSMTIKKYNLFSITLIFSVQSTKTAL